MEACPCFFRPSPAKWLIRYVHLGLWREAEIKIVRTDLELSHDGTVIPVWRWATLNAIRTAVHPSSLARQAIVISDAQIEIQVSAIED